jgi:hypothetical protein
MTIDDRSPLTLPASASGRVLDAAPPAGYLWQHNRSDHHAEHDLLDT